jgi:alcohol dehydrogenase
MLHALEVLALRIYMAIFKVVTALMPFKWPRMFEGTGSSLDLVRHMASVGHRNVLIVTDAVLVKLGVLDKMKAELETQGVKYLVYDGVEPNPTVEQIEAGYRILMENGCQAILAVGQNDWCTRKKQQTRIETDRFAACAQRHDPPVCNTHHRRYWR